VDYRAVATFLPVEWRRGDYVISTDRERLDRDVIHRYLSEEAYWSKGIPRERVDRSIGASLCFGLYRGEAQAGFARVVTDGATFAYLGDVFVLERHRGHGLGVWLIETVMGHPDLAGLRSVVLFTADAHGLYERFGFSTPPPDRVRRLMTISLPPEIVYRDGD
jgi:GNAT superfamily N-acetyltransferase